MKSKTSVPALKGGFVKGEGSTQLVLAYLFKEMLRKNRNDALQKKTLTSTNKIRYHLDGAAGGGTKKTVYQQGTIPAAVTANQFRPLIATMVV